MSGSSLLGRAVAIGCGVGWGVIVAMPIADRVRRRSVLDRFGSSSSARRPRRWSGWDGGPVGRVVRGVMRSRRDRWLHAQLVQDLPSALDLLAVAVGGGASPRGALETAARWGPPRIAEQLRRAVTVTDLGGSLPEALHDLGLRVPVLAPISDVLIASAQLGAPAGPALARLGNESRSALRRQAEARARTLPVKLLFPLVFLVLPAFGLLTVAPAVLSALQRL